MLALTDTFAVAAAVHLNVPVITIGILAGLPLFMGSIGQLLVANYFSSKNGLKRYVIIGTGTQSLLLFVIALTGFLPDHTRAWFYVITFTMQGFFGNIVAGLWMAWMSNLVQASLRSRYFAWRSRIISFAQLVCGISAGALAFRHTVENSSWFFFLMVFLAAGSFRFISTLLLSAQYEHPKPLFAKYNSTLPSAPLVNRDFLYFSIITALMQGAVMLGSPFFNLWYIRDLHFTFLTLSISTAAMVSGAIIMLPLWGKLSDRFGHHSILKVSGFMIAAIPLPFLFTDNPALLCMFNLYTGACWSGYNLSSFNHLLALSNDSNAERQISLSIALTGFAVFLFSLLGGYLAPKLPTVFGWHLQTLFCISMLLRLTVFFSFFLKIPRTRTDFLEKKADRLLFVRRLWDRM
jgi:MFS family permease